MSIATFYPLYTKSRSVLECKDYILACKLLNFWADYGIMVDVVPRKNGYVVRPLSTDDEFKIREKLYEFETSRIPTQNC